MDGLSRLLVQLLTAVDDFEVAPQIAQVALGVSVQVAGGRDPQVTAAPSARGRETVFVSLVRV